MTRYNRAALIHEHICWLPYDKPVKKGTYYEYIAQ